MFQNMCLKLHTLSVVQVHIAQPNVAGLPDGNLTLACNFSQGKSYQQAVNSVRAYLSNLTACQRHLHSMAACCSIVSSSCGSSSCAGRAVVGCAHAAIAASCQRPAHELQNGGLKVQLGSTPPYTALRPTSVSCNQQHHHA